MIATVAGIRPRANRAATDPSRGPRRLRLRRLPTVVVTSQAIILLLSGCALQEKAEHWERAAENFANPDKIRVCYTREGRTIKGSEHRCFGEDCELAECPQ